MTERTSGNSAAAVESRPALGVRLLDLAPVAWLALVASAGAILAANAESPERAGLEAADRAALPLLCLLGIAAIIRYFCLRNGQSRRAPEMGQGEDPL